MHLHEEYLFVSLSGQSLLKIDCSDGSLVWQKNINDRIKFYDSDLINLDASAYREISPNDGTVLHEVTLTEEYKRHGFRSIGANSNFTIDQTHIYIVDPMGWKAGALNRKTGQLDWSANIGLSNVTLPHPPIVTKSELFVLDDIGTLHIFDRET